MILDSKLQLKPGQTLAVLFAAFDPQFEAENADASVADVVLVFVRSPAQLAERAHYVTDALARGSSAWVAYPKTRQMGTDFNREILQRLMAERDADAVRHITLNDNWAVTRFEKLPAA